MENPFAGYESPAINEVFSDAFKSERVTDKINAYAAEVTARLVHEEAMTEFLEGEEFTLTMTVNDLEPYLDDLEDDTLRELGVGILICGLLNATSELDLTSEDDEPDTPFCIMLRRQEESDTVNLVAQILPEADTD